MRHFVHCLTGLIVLPAWKGARVRLAYAAYFGPFPGLRRPADDLRAAFRPCPNFDGHDRLEVAPAQGLVKAEYRKQKKMAGLEAGLAKRIMLRKSRRGKLLLSNERPRIEVGSPVSCGVAYVIERAACKRCGVISLRQIHGTSLGPRALGFVEEYYAKRSTDETVRTACFTSAGKASFCRAENFKRPITWPAVSDSHILRKAEKHAIKKGGNYLSCYRRLLAIYKRIKGRESASCAECLDLERAVIEIAAAYA